MRSRERLAAIDSYIKENYPIDGPDAVAKALGEPRAYIMARAHLKKIRMHDTPPKSSKKVVKGKSKKDKIIADLTMRNNTLRRELIKQAHTISQLRKYGI